MKKIALTLLSAIFALGFSTDLSYAMDDDKKDISAEEKSSSASKFAGSVEKLSSIDHEKLVKAKKDQHRELVLQTKQVEGHKAFAEKLEIIKTDISQAFSTVKTLATALNSASEEVKGFSEKFEKESSLSKTEAVDTLRHIAGLLEEEGFGKQNLQLLKGTVPYSSSEGHALLTLKNFNVSQIDIKYHAEVINTRAATSVRNKPSNVNLFVSLTAHNTKTIFEKNVADVLKQMDGSSVLTICCPDAVVSLKDVVLLKDSSNDQSDVAQNLFGSGVTRSFKFNVNQKTGQALKFALGEENAEDTTAHIFELNCAPYGSVLNSVSTMINLPGRSPVSFKPVLASIADQMKEEVDAKSSELNEIEARAAEILEKINSISK